MKQLTYSHIITILLLILVAFWAFTSTNNTRYLNRENKALKQETKELAHEVDSLSNEIKTRNLKIEASEKRIANYETKLNQTLGKLTQIQNQYLYEKTHPVPHDQRADAIRNLAKQ